MSIIDSGTLAELQAIAEGVMLDTVTLQRPGERTALPGGGSTFAPGAIVHTAGRVGPLSKSTVEAVSADQLRQEGVEQLSVPLGTEVQGDETATLVSARHGTTTVYDVVGVVPAGTYAVERKLLVRRKDG
jgi:hypothetical protein